MVWYSFFLELCNDRYKMYLIYIYTNIQLYTHTCMHTYAYVHAQALLWKDVALLSRHCLSPTET